MNSFYTVTLDHSEGNFVFDKRDNANRFLWNCYMTECPNENREQRIEAQYELHTTNSINGIGAVQERQFTI